MKVVFSSRAKNDLTEIITYISYDKPQATRKWAADIRKSVLKLSDFPRLGRIVPEYGDPLIREIIKGQYRIVYKIDEKKNTRVVVTVHHSRRTDL